MTSDIEEIRSARATLGWLFEPGSRWLTRMLAEHGPIGTAAIARDGQLPHDQLRQELRQASPSRLPQQRMWQTAAGAVHAQRHLSRVLIPEDADWPDGLRDCGVDVAWDPVCLWARGPAAVAPVQRSVAVIGARSSSPYGQQTAADWAYALAEAGHTVVSSSGYGIDEAALRAALAYRGAATPMVVQPCGLDLMHPQSSRRLLEQATEEALVLSAWPPGAQPRFDRSGTNQLLIAALTAGTVVVEASVRSKALHAVSHAIRLGRIGMAVPGPVTSARSAGCHQLLRTEPRAWLVTSAGDVLDLLPSLS